MPTLEHRTQFIKTMNEVGIGTVFHYVPLHSSLGDKNFSRSGGSLGVTDNISDRLVRLSLWVGLEAEIDRALEAANKALKSMKVRMNLIVKKSFR
jgi:dTDP-4-amino-4,6-dideoxygalactose transaminase